MAHNPAQTAKTPARDTKTDALFLIGSILTAVIWLLLDTGYFLALLWGIGLAHLICYWLPPRPPEKLLPWLNRQMLPYALFYGFSYKLPQLLVAWLPVWAYLLPTTALFIGMQVHTTYSRQRAKLTGPAAQKSLAP
jgi:hypothetical protein